MLILMKTHQAALIRTRQHLAFLHSLVLHVRSLEAVPGFEQSSKPVGNFCIPKSASRLEALARCGRLASPANKAGLTSQLGACPACFEPDTALLSTYSRLPCAFEPLMSHSMPALAWAQLEWLKCISWSLQLPDMVPQLCRC